MAETLLIQLGDGVFDAQNARTVSISNLSFESKVLNKTIYDNLSSEARVNPIGTFGSTFIDTTAWTPNPKTRRLLQVWNNCFSRSTAKADDVPVIFATLLGFSTKEILAIPPEDRMKAMLCAQEEIPLKILFNQTNKSPLTDLIRFTDRLVLGTAEEKGKCTGHCI